MVKRLFLMRHGETAFNQKKAFYGSKDISINENGIKQAKVQKQIMKNYSIDKVITSELKRTKETALIIFTEQVHQQLKEMNEKDFGLWEGLNANEIQERFPQTWEKWLEKPFDVVPEQAESFQQFNKRVEKGLEKILNEKVNNIACIFHLGVLRLIYQKLIDPNKSFWDIDFPQGSITIFIYQNSQWEIETILT